MMATQIVAGQRPIVAAKMHMSTHATQKACPRAIIASSSMKSTAFVSGTAALRAAQPAKMAVKARSGAALAVRSEISYVMIKPDGVQRGLVGEIISRFEKKGFKLVAMKLYQTPRELAEEHYKDLSSRPFFKDLVDYIISGPVVCMVWEGDNVVKTVRKMLGATNPADAEPGTIRGDFARVSGRNVCHASDSPENGVRETELWFGKDAVISWDATITPWLIE